MTTEPPIRRLTLLLTSPRVPSGVLTRDAWLALEQAAVILAREDEPQAEALAAAGMTVTHPDPSGDEAPHLARALVARALADGPVVWVGSSDGDPGLTDGIAGEVSRLADPPEVEVVVGSYDVPGARLLDLVAVMDRLRSPGGCPWDAEQTHTSLVPYLVEEAHEAVEAIESGDRAHMVEELGDVLLQVAFHARVAQEHGSDPFDIDDVAAGIVAKLVRRHPHVFADSGPDPDAADDTAAGPDAAAVEVSWESIKDAEKAGAPGAGEGGVLAGIPVAMPPLARATKIASRVRRRSRQDLLDAVLTAHAASDSDSDSDADSDSDSDSDADSDAEGRLGDPGARLLALVVELEAAGVDPDTALRRVLREVQRRSTLAGG